jgi:DNA repair protein RecO (recombination protein O)
MWRAVLYFSYWAVRLGGFLPELRVTLESRALAGQIAATPIGGLAGVAWTKETGADLRRALVRELQDHLERKLVTAALLETL